MDGGDELAESKRQIEELAHALAEERARAARAAAAEAALQSGDDGASQTDPAGDSNWRLVDARMFMSTHPILSERAAFRRLPSVVTWFGAASQSSLLTKAASCGNTASYGNREGDGRAALRAHSEVKIDVQQVRELREHESHIWCVPPLQPCCTTVRATEPDGPCVCIMQVLCAAPDGAAGCDGLKRHHSAAVAARRRVSAGAAWP